MLRNYSLSGQPGADYYRITVKREQHGAASGYLHSRIAVTSDGACRPGHLVAPRRTQQPRRAHAARSLLRPGGVVMIETPTIDCLWFRVAPSAGGS